mmetsp:Transcript_16666/g.44782  ORF Transcript_16666/g.44782 Transcript_16666/m.44782 type:complete len:164 (+) Transcript_16666:867-1358(+)
MVLPSVSSSSRKSVLTLPQARRSLTSILSDSGLMVLRIFRLVSRTNKLKRKHKVLPPALCAAFPYIEPTCVLFFFEPLERCDEALDGLGLARLRPAVEDAPRGGSHGYFGNGRDDPTFLSVVEGESATTGNRLTFTSLNLVLCYLHRSIREILRVVHWKTLGE